jgi:hypothetical protein
MYFWILNFNKRNNIKTKKLCYLYKCCSSLMERRRLAVRAPDKLRICIFYAMKMSKHACIIRSECTHYEYILLCMQTFQIRSVLVVVYIAIHFCLWEIPHNYFPLYFTKERAYTSDGYWMFAFLSIDVAVNITNKCGLRNK